MLEEINPYHVKDREHRGRDTILIVDDIEVNRIILQSIFERDYNLLEAENGEQAMVLLKQYHGNIAARASGPCDAAEGWLSGPG